jgi:nucleotide-binding universal stress UspA family protein
MTSPFSHILLVTEHTEFDVGAERVGIDLAASCSIPLYAVFPLVSNTEFQILAPELEEKAEIEAVEKLETLQQVANGRGVELHSTIRRGETPFREVIEEAHKQAADLIILRRRGKHSYLANMLLGELVHTVTGHAHCDVLAVPRAAQLWSRGIVLATDGSPHSDRATSMAVALAIKYNLPLTIISVAEHKKGEAADESTAQANVERALVSANAAGAQATGRVVANDKPYRAILEVAVETGADLIVIGRRGLNRVERILVGSTSEQVAGSASSAVLIVHQLQKAGLVE